MRRLEKLSTNGKSCSNQGTGEDFSVISACTEQRLHYLQMSHNTYLKYIYYPLNRIRFKQSVTLRLVSLYPETFHRINWS